MFEMMPWRKRGSGDLVGFKGEIDNLFHRFFDPDFPMSRELFKETQWLPRMDVHEGEKDITVQVEIPGCNVEDIDVSLEGRMLTVTGEKKHEKEEKEKNRVRIERFQGNFTRTVELSCEVDEKKVEATYKKGVLKIVLQKTEPTQRKKIAIQTT